MIQCLPLIGLEIGVIWYLLGWLCGILKLPAMLTALVLAAAPWLLTGLMHMDGFMDVTDAVKSWRSLERRLEILKDSHVGSFAVIYCILVLLAQFSSFVSAADADLRILILVPAVSRCCSALAVITLPPMSTSQYAAREKSAKNQIFPAAVLVICLIVGFLFGVKPGCTLGAETAVYLVSLRRAYKSLEGMNGDISGYCIVLSELAAAAAMAIL